MNRTLWKLLAAAVCAIGIAAPAVADVLADILQKGVVRVAVFQDLTPFSSQNASRELEGFDIDLANPFSSQNASRELEGLDIDLANLMAKGLGVKLEIVPVTAANRIPTLLTDKADVIIALMSVTPERAKQIMFTAPYVNTSLAIYGPKSAVVKSAADLGKFRLAAARGTTEELIVSALNSSANIMRTEDNATATAAYLSGQAQLLAANSLIVLELAKKIPKKEFDLKLTLRRAPGHMGVKMGEHNLRVWIDSFVFVNTLNGELDKLHRKWLNQSMEPLPAF
jgi:polar amino acid transport system substrate-binding protein